MWAAAKLTIEAREAEADTLRKANEILSRRPTSSKLLEGVAIGAGIAFAVDLIVRLIRALGGGS